MSEKGPDKRRDIMSLQKYVKVIHAGLDEDEDGSIILRGRIDPETLDALQIDDYQREILPVSNINQIMQGFEPGGSVPDIDLGMRGARTRDADDVFTLLDDVYIIDGQQRVTAAKRYRLQGKVPRLGATIHFNTTKKWEIDRFRTLNADRIKVSPNVLIRNTRDEYDVISALYNMSENDNQFVMKGRICWSQSKQRLHLITALTMLKAIGIMHSHLSPGLSGMGKELCPALEKTFDLVGRNIFRENVRTYFQIIEDCWGIRTVTYAGACHLRNTFLFSLARLLCNHPTFWRENKVFIEMDLLRKLKTFPVQDPTVQQLSGAGGQAGKMLYSLMVEHINRGKRTKRLKQRIADDLESALPELAGAASE